MGCRHPIHSLALLEAREQAPRHGLASVRLDRHDQIWRRKRAESPRVPRPWRVPRESPPAAPDPIDIVYPRVGAGA
jgi:hypothetical protein